jgi:hypothetical protein
MAPLVALAVAVVLDALVGLFKVDEVKEGVDVGPVVPEDEDDPPARGAVDCPAISARTDEEKEPVILSRVNWAEKAS